MLLAQQPAILDSTLGLFSIVFSNLNANCDIKSPRNLIILLSNIASRIFFRDQFFEVRNIFFRLYR